MEGQRRPPRGRGWARWPGCPSRWPGAPPPPAARERERRPTSSARLLRGHRTTRHAARGQQRAIGVVDLDAVRRHQPRAQHAEPVQRSRPGSDEAARTPRVPARGGRGRRSNLRRGRAGTAARAETPPGAGRTRRPPPPSRAGAPAETECGAWAASDHRDAVRRLDGGQARPARPPGRVAAACGSQPISSKKTRARRDELPSRSRCASAFDTSPTPAVPVSSSSWIPAEARGARSRRVLRGRVVDQALDPVHEPGCLDQPSGQVRQLEMAMRIDEAGQEHARAQVARLSVRRLGGRTDPAHAPVLHRHRRVAQRRPVHGHDPSRAEEHHFRSVAEGCATRRGRPGRPR